MGIQALPIAKIHILVSWFRTCTLVGEYQHFRTFCIHIQDCTFFGNVRIHQLVLQIHWGILNLFQIQPEWNVKMIWILHEVCNEVFDLFTFSFVCDFGYGHPRNINCNYKCLTSSWFEITGAMKHISYWCNVNKQIKQLITTGST